MKLSGQSKIGWFHSSSSFTLVCVFLDECTYSRPSVASLNKFQCFFSLPGCPAIGVVWQYLSIMLDLQEHRSFHFHHRRCDPCICTVSIMGLDLCHIHRFLQVQLRTSGLLRSIVATPGIRTWAMYLLWSLSIHSCNPELNLSVPLAT